jgi:hypothetical protein
VPTIVCNVNIGVSFYDLNFNRDIPRGRVHTKEHQVHVAQTYQNVPMVERSGVG